MKDLIRGLNGGPFASEAKFSPKLRVQISHPVVSKTRLLCESGYFGDGVKPEDILRDEFVEYLNAIFSSNSQSAGKDLSIFTKRLKALLSMHGMTNVVAIKDAYSITTDQKSSYSMISKSNWIDDGALERIAEAYFVRVDWLNGNGGAICPALPEEIYFQNDLSCKSDRIGIGGYVVNSDIILLKGEVSFYGKQTRIVVERLKVSLSEYPTKQVAFLYKILAKGDMGGGNLTNELNKILKKSCDMLKDHYELPVSANDIQLIQNGSSHIAEVITANLVNLKSCTVANLKEWISQNTVSPSLLHSEEVVKIGEVI